MSSGKKFINKRIKRITEDQIESLRIKAEEQIFIDSITTDLKMLIINYFEENFDGLKWCDEKKSNYQNCLINCVVFGRKLCNYNPTIFTCCDSLLYLRIYYQNTQIDIMEIWKKIWSEYVENFKDQL